MYMYMLCIHSMYIHRPHAVAARPVPHTSSAKSSSAPGKCLETSVLIMVTCVRVRVKVRVRVRV